MYICTVHVPGTVIGTGDGTEEEEGEEEELTKKRKPWGDTSYFCPVALGEKGVLWPGSEEHAVRFVTISLIEYCGHTCTCNFYRIRELV